MSASWIVYLSWVFLATWANGQGEIEWQNSMDGLELPEDIQNGVVIATLSATYQGSSNNIIYGINENVNDPKDITVKEQGSRMLVFQNGTVMTYNAEFKFESGITSVSVNLIARVRGTDIVNKKTSVIKIRDVNNLAPVFTKQDYTATVVENYEPPGGRLLLVGNITVEDIDTVLTDIKWLEVIISKCTKSKEEEETRCGNRFSLERTLYDTKSYTGNFYIHEPLDYEDASSWQVTLQAFQYNVSIPATWQGTVCKLAMPYSLTSLGGPDPTLFDHHWDNLDWWIHYHIPSQWPHFPYWNTS